jgi:hypothetical protein
MTMRPAFPTSMPTSIPAAILASACMLVLVAAGAVSAAPLSPPPVIRVKEAVYRLDQNVIEFSFTVTNPSDSVIYVDCEGQPAATLAGKALSLRFAAADSLAADTARPQRVGARQGYQGSRRLFGLGPDALGSAHPTDPLKAASLRVQMAVYPERLDGEGTAWMLERAMPVAAKPVPLRKAGKRPPAPKPTKVITPAE